jgi:hypothetical protein
MFGALYKLLKIKNWELGKKKEVDLDCFYVHLFGLKSFFWNFEFLLGLKSIF